MGAQSASPNDGPVIVQNAGATDIPILTANVMRTFVTPPPAIMELGTILDEAGEEFALVGGPVRDMLLGITPRDFDTITSACPERTGELLAQWGNATWSIGKEFGTTGGRRGDLVVEVTTYHTDGYETGSHKPKVTFGDTLEGNLTRRDFTVNAMAMRLPRMALVGSCGRLADFAGGSLYTPASAEQSFDDDPLRIMRAARFSAQLGLDVDMDVMNAMETMTSHLEIASAERIHAKPERFIISPHLRCSIELMVYTGVIGIVLPEVTNLVSTADEYKHHKGVYEHTLIVVERAMDLKTGPDGAVPAPDSILRFAVLMYDIGKPATRRSESNGTVSLHHHEIVGAKMTRKRMKALHFDEVTIEAVPSLVVLHLRLHGCGEVTWFGPVVRRYVADAGDLLEYLHRLARADCTTRNHRKANYLFAVYNGLETRITALREQEELDAIRPDLDDDQIMEVLGLRPSHAVKIARDYLLELCVGHGLLGEKAARQAFLDWWASDDVHVLAEEYQVQQVYWEAKTMEKKARKAATKAAREAQGQ